MIRFVRFLAAILVLSSFGLARAQEAVPSALDRLQGTWEVTAGELNLPLRKVLNVSKRKILAANKPLKTIEFRGAASVARVGVDRESFVFGWDFGDPYQSPPQFVRLKESTNPPQVDLYAGG